MITMFGGYRPTMLIEVDVVYIIMLFDYFTVVSRVADWQGVDNLD